MSIARFSMQVRSRYWMVPGRMSSHVHEFNAHEGGAFHISLTYDVPAATGKTSMDTDTHHGRFVKPVPNEQVVEVMEFETSRILICAAR
jgi:uncharacterized protein YndB with AHSA1/START domain